LPQQSSSTTIGNPFIELQSVDSTNNYAMACIHEGLAQAGTAVFAHHQTKGKGQRNKSWASEENANISISLILQPSFLPVSNQFKLSACMAVATQHFFSKYAGEETSIKWPNDIYWRDRKAAGILIENIMGSGAVQWKWAVAGIGININQTSFGAGLKNPVSLRQITGKNQETVTLAKEFCKIADHFYKRLIEEDFESIFKLYNQCLYKKNQVVKFKKGNRIFKAIVKEVSINGQLVVEHGVEEYFNAGEVEWIL
jgi:BirA family transcriptional regulator, biotin operon repressor / biotin---[acetyl-CoA-carboxylase] ligase